MESQQGIVSSILGDLLGVNIIPYERPDGDVRIVGLHLIPEEEFSLLNGWHEMDPREKSAYEEHFSSCEPCNKRFISVDKSNLN